LQQIFKKCHTPADQCGNEPGFAGHIFQMRVPGKGHKTIGANQEKDCSPDNGNGMNQFKSFHDIFFLNGF
jgi:hypothetical protein